MHISYSSCAKATTNVLSSVFLYLVIDWKGNGVFWQRQGFHSKSNGIIYPLSLLLQLSIVWPFTRIHFTICEKVLGPKGREVHEGSQVLRFWRLMPKGEKILSPKQKDRTTISKKIEMNFSIYVFLKKLVSNFQLICVSKILNWHLF
jgi:hypothetical protein